MEIRRVVTAILTALSLALVVPVGNAVAESGRPVIVVNGTFGPNFFYEPLKWRLESDGYRVWTFELVNLGVSDINQSARALEAFVADVRGRTGASQVDLIGHSQGGLVARQYIKAYGGSSTVNNLITLSAPNYGTELANLVDLFAGYLCGEVASCQQMAVGSDFLAELNSRDDTYGPVRYTTFRTLWDEVVLPVDNAILYDGATNVLIQDQCPFRVVAHAGMALDGTGVFWDQ